MKPGAKIWRNIWANFVLMFKMHNRISKTILGTVNPKKISINLSIDEVNQLFRILKEEDPEEALRFIKESLLKRVLTALQSV